MTATSTTVPVPVLRTSWGTPLRWSKPGRFGVLFSHTDYVTDTRHDPTTQTQVEVVTADTAAELAATVLKAQPGIEFEVMRLEGDQWRDYQGRTRPEVTAARWGDLT